MSPSELIARVTDWFAQVGSTDAIQPNFAYGYNQTLQNVLASRAVGTIYTNTTPRPILVIVNGVTTVAPGTLVLRILSLNVDVAVQPAASSGIAVSAIVPPGATYDVPLASNTTITGWAEYR